MASTRALGTGAFATLLLIAFMMGANHVAARLAFNHGVDVATAVSFRSALTALAVGALVLVQRVPLKLSARHRRMLPQAPAGWWGLAALTLLYGTAFTIMFTVLPRLGVVGGSAIMNVEPVFALVLAWALLGQGIAPVQLAGAGLVVGTVVWLGLRRR
ncbi:EamA family transporter [Ramlibacter sp. 2FC]|uniref:EamA family transporter n=1 Tax=Ramlibacter sp. 2FC TaxID=2502188 RepID=UPI0010F48F1A|nr:EamA family transporter [Ramlibacter sp. 2FC]